MNFSFARSKALCSLVATVVAAGVVVVAPASAQAQMPSAQDVIQKYIEATGGKQAMEKVTSLQVRGKMELNAPGVGIVTADLSVHQTSDAFLLSIAMPGAGDLVQGRNGDVAWAARSDGSIAQLDGQEKLQMMQNARMHEQLHWADFDGEITVAGEADVDGRATWQLSFKPTNGIPAERYFDKETGLLLKVSMNAVTEAGELPTDSFFSDYREFEGMKMACEMKQVVQIPDLPNMEMVFKYEDVKVNEEIPAERFEPPAGIDG